jgi:hypothetical protein
LGTENQVTKPAPWLRRHIVQWQCAQKRLGIEASNFTRPHRHAPETGAPGSRASAELIVHLDFALLGTDD